MSHSFKKLFFFLLITLMGFSQTILDQPHILALDDSLELVARYKRMKALVSGPLSGLTHIPSARKFMLYSSYYSASSTSGFDDKGSELSYQDNYENRANPDASLAVLSLAGEYAYNSRMGLSFYMPFITHMKLSGNPTPGYEAYYPDLSGETGLGDIHLGLWVLLESKRGARVKLFIDQKLPSGSNPDDLSDDALQATGDGLWAFSYGAMTDFSPGKRVLLSLAAQATIPEDDTLHHWSGTYPLEIPTQTQFTSRIIVEASRRINLGLRLSYISADKLSIKELDHVMIDFSDYSQLTLRSSFAYRISKASPIIDLDIAYSSVLQGKNIGRYEGPSLGLQLSF